MADKILIVRTDRLGDVLLTTPVSASIRKQRPDAKIYWLVRPYAEPLLKNNPDVDGVILDKGGPVGALVDTLRKEQFTAAIVAYPRSRAAWAVWRAGIPVRIGPASKIYSLLFNHRVWQHRSKGERHEADYNLELLAPLGLSTARTPTRFVLTDEERQQARKYLESMRLPFTRPIVAIHPGSGGSAARWPLKYFMELGDRLQESGVDVIVTAGPGESYQNIMIDQMRRIPVFVAAGSVTVRELAALFSWMNVVVSNSTGPLHLAVALGVPTVSIYSPLATTHPRRWGPYPDFAEGGTLHKVFIAPMRTETETAMDEVTVESVLEACRRRLEGSASTPVGR